MPRRPLNPAEFIGKKYNKLTLIEYVGKRPKSTGHFFRCKCDCGKEAVVRLIKMKTGETKSCGCLVGKYNRKRGGLTAKYRRLYIIWQGMQRRCYDPDHVGYKRYGARGISMCDEWQMDFKPFCEWAIGNGYSVELTLDRKNNDDGYSSDNCRWVTHKTQQNNKSNNVYITYKGATRTSQEWSELTGIKAKTIVSRFKKGWPLDKVFSSITYITLL